MTTLRHSRKLCAAALFPVLLALLLAPMMLTSCSHANGGPPPLDQIKPLLRMGVSLGVDRLLTANPGMAPQVLQVTTVLFDLFDEGAFTSIAEVRAFLQTHIPWAQLSPEMRPLVEALIVAISEELKVIAEHYHLSAGTHLLLIREVLDWVKEAAQRHILFPPPPPVKLRKA